MAKTLTVRIDDATYRLIAEAAAVEAAFQMQR